MLLRQLHSFVAVVECGSFTEAAERCYLSQSAISQQIQALEQELGVSLLIRGNRRFSLTPAGEFVYQQGKRLLAQANALRREAVRIGRGDTARLTLGYPLGYSGQELYQAVAEFSRQYPEVSIDIVNGTHEELYDFLRSGRADLILSDQRRAFSDAYVNFELLSCGCYAELSAQNPLSLQAALHLEDLASIPCILLASRTQQNTEQAYFQDTLGFSGRFLFAETLGEARLMVAGNRGFLPLESIGTLPAPETSVRRLPICVGDRQLKRNYCLFWSREHSSAYPEAFAAILRGLLPTP